MSSARFSLLRQKSVRDNLNNQVSPICRGRNVLAQFRAFYCIEMSTSRRYSRRTFDARQNQRVLSPNSLSQSIFFTPPNLFAPFVGLFASVYVPSKLDTCYHLAQSLALRYIITLLIAPPHLCTGGPDLTSRHLARKTGGITNGFLQSHPFRNPSASYIPNPIAPVVGKFASVYMYPRFWLISSISLHSWRLEPCGILSHCLLLLQQLSAESRGPSSRHLSREMSGIINAVLQ